MRAASSTLNSLLPSLHDRRVDVRSARLGGRRGKADPNPPRTPHLNNGADDREGEAQAVLDAAAVLVVAVVGGVADELLEQVVVGGVDLDAVEAGGLGVLGGTTVVLDDHGDLVGGQGPRLHMVLHAVRGEGLALRTDRGGRHWLVAVVQIGV
jgi:hypothetical protein